MHTTIRITTTLLTTLALGLMVSAGNASPQGGAHELEHRSDGYHAPPRGFGPTLGVAPRSLIPINSLVAPSATAQNHADPHATHPFGALGTNFQSAQLGPEARARGGIKGRMAPALQVTNWTNLPEGRSSIDVTDYRGDVVVLFFFQSWCPGCHSRGFPTIDRLIKEYGTDGDVGFLTVQTVFEGEDVNTPERGRESLERHGLTIPLGHDVRGENRRESVMGRYRTRGTPWIVIIDRDGIVRFNHFHISASNAIELIDRLRHPFVGPPAR